MPNINRRSIRSRVPAPTTLAAANSLTGAAITMDVSGANRIIIAQINNGTDGTAGVDAIELSKDNGKQWAADDTLLAIASDENVGAVLAAGVLNVAGTEPLGAALFKSGPHNGPTLMRCARLTGTGGGTSWVTGAPQVIAVKVG